MIDRKRGALYGLAIGDALGAAVEFRMPGEFEPVTGYRGGGPHGIEAGQWTDDTSMALALADSIKGNYRNLININDHATKYLQWWQYGKYSVNGRCFDIGTQTRYSLMEFERTGNAWISGNPSEENSGNGSIMRLAPIVIYTADYTIEEMLVAAENSSIPTHPSPQCRDACRYMATIMRACMNGHTKESALAPIEKLHPLVQMIADGSYKTKQPPDICGGGWVIHSLEAALWAFWNSNSFEEAVLKAVNLGNDADSTGAVCGQIAGAYYGYSAIPQHLIDGLDRKDMIEEALDED